MTYEWSGVLLIAINGDLIAMHRDDKPDIRHPGCYGIFGGAVEKGETALEAATREIKEETNLKVRSEDFELFRVYHQDRDYLDKPAKLNVFILRDINPEELKVYEGQGIKLLKNADSPNISQDVREAFEDWFKLQKKT